MSQINIQNLLNTDPIQPSVAPIAIQPEYSQSSFFGGKTQLGEMPQQVGESSEAAMYGALAEIAGGTAKAINTFADISSRMDKEKIDKAELYFNELNTKTDLTPDQKQEEFDKYTREIWTPILGDNWRKQMALAADKNWTSKAARNDYEASRYERIYSEWLRRPENKGRPETNESIQEFNSYYELKFPSAKYNDWYTQVATKVDSAIALKNAEQAVIDFRGAVEISYQVPSQEALNAYYNSANMEQNAKFEETYRTFFELKKSIDSVSDFGEMNAFVFKHMAESLGPKMSSLKPEAARMVAFELDQLAQAKTKELFGIVQAENITQLKTQAALNLGSNENNFQITKDVNGYLNNLTQNIGNLSAIERRGQVDNIIPFIWKTLSSGNSQSAIDFRNQPIDKQIEAVEKAFKDWYGETLTNFEQLSGVTKDGLDLFLARGRAVIFADENLGGKTISIGFDGLKENASQTQSIFALQNEDQIQNSMEAYRTKVASMLGISIESVQRLAYTFDAKKVPSFSTEPLVVSWFKTLPDAEKQILIDRGFTANSFAKLEDFRTTYIDLESKAKIASAKVSSVSSGSSDLSGPVDKLSDEELKAKLLMDPGLRSTGFTAREISKDSTKASGLGVDEQLSLSRVDLVMSDMETRFRAFVSERASIGQKVGRNNIPTNLELFKNSDGSVISLSLSPQSLMGKIEVDETGSLTPKGIEAALRLEFAAMEMARIEPSNSSENAFKTEAKALLVQVSKSGFATVATQDPKKIYALTSLLVGLSQGDPNFISSQTFTGTDSGQLTAMASLLKVAHSLSGGILDTTPADFGDPNVRLGYKTNKDGTIRPLTKEEKTLYDEHPMRKAINAWGVAMDVFGTPVATAGEGMMNPLVSNDRFDKPVSIKDEVASVITAYTRAGPNSYRNNESLLALINRLNFPGAKTDAERITAFGQALHQVSGQVSPALDADDATLVSIPTDTGFIWKAWNDLEPEQKIGVYLADLSRIDPDTTQMLFTGWLRNAGNPGTEDIYNLDMFVGTAGFIRDDLLKSRISPLGVVQPRQYQNRTFQNGPTDSRLSVQVVNDGRNVSRRDIFNQALALSYSTYKVNTEQVQNTWTDPGTFEDRIIPIGVGTDGKPIYSSETQNVRIGEVTSEDQFVLTTQLAATMDPDDSGYAYYKWWSNVIGKTPVSKDQYVTAVNDLTLDNVVRGPSVAFGSSGMAMTRVGTDDTMTVRPALFSVMQTLHQVDLTDSNVEIAVDHKGDMYYNIGNKRYLVSERPLISPKTQFSNNDTPENEKALFQYNRRKLETERANKRAAFKLKVPAPVYTASRETVTPHPQVVSTNLNRYMNDYMTEVFSSENPYDFMIKNPFSEYRDKRWKQEHPNVVNFENALKYPWELIKGAVTSGFRYVPEDERQRRLEKQYMIQFQRMFNKAFQTKPTVTPPGSLKPKTLFKSFDHFVNWLMGIDQTKQLEQVKTWQENRKQVSDSYLETRLRSSWKPALESLDSLKRSDYKTQQEWNEARQALRKRNEKAEREGY